MILELIHENDLEGTVETILYYTDNSPFNGEEEAIMRLVKVMESLGYDVMLFNRGDVTFYCVCTIDFESDTLPVDEAVIEILLQDVYGHSIAKRAQTTTSVDAD